MYESFFRIERRLNKVATSALQLGSSALIVLLLSALSFSIFGSYRLKNPSLLFEYQTTCDVRQRDDCSVKVYFDRGEGMNQHHSNRQSITQQHRWVPIRLELPKAVIHNIWLRFDNPNAEFLIRDLRIIDAFGTNRLDISPASMQSSLSYNPTLENFHALVISTDQFSDNPQLKIKSDGDIDLRVSRHQQAWAIATGLFGWMLLWLAVVIDVYVAPRFLGWSSIILSLIRNPAAIAAGVAVALVAMIFYIERNPEKLSSTYFRLAWACDFNQSICRSLTNPFRILVDTNYEIRQKYISKFDAPVLRIYMTDDALTRLNNKRQEVLSEKRPILLASDDDWVRAIILSDNGISKRKVQASLRLKGDWGEHHLSDPRKLSFRIKVRNNDLVFGMSKFSIQRPSTRFYQNEALMLAMMRRIGVLAPRYFFVDVRINNQKVGIMALEEHFTKEMVEAQSRREGPILAVDEDWIWQELFLCFNRNPTTCDIEGLGSSNLGSRDRRVKVFRAGGFNPETVRSQHMMRAVSLFRDEIEGRKDVDLGFDLNLTSLWWMMVQVWEGKHGLAGINLRHYFNPITGRLEPVSFDNNSTPHNNNYRWRTHDENISQPFHGRDLLRSSTFRELMTKNIQEMEELLVSETFSEWFTSEQNRHLRVLWFDGIPSEPVLISDLKKNLFEFSEQLEGLFASSDASTEPRSMTEDREDDPIHGRKYMEKSGTSLYTHLRPFWFWSVDGTEIELKNLTLHPITVHSVFFSKRPENSLVPTEVGIPVYQKGSGRTDHIFKSPIEVTEFDLSDQMHVSYSYRGQEYTRPVFLQFRNYESGYKSLETARAWFAKNGVVLDRATKTITFPPGNYFLEASLETEKDWRIELLAGALLEFKQGARLKVNGPVHALGHKDLPVQLMITSDPTRNLLGSWGGLLVVEANRESILRHTQVTGAATQGFSERQDAHGLTGCITFYKSNVRIEHSRFSGLQCEDALNIISSKFIIDSSEFVDANADAFDSDFSDGIVSTSVFRNIMNDGIDVSGSQVQVGSSQFSDIRDKAISVGENSTLDASKLTIGDADTGVVSKDNSVVNIRNSSFKGVSNALMAYVKKKEWGPAEIHCDNCLFDHVENIAVEQHASRITIDGQEVLSTPFSRKQLQIAGYVQ